MKNKMTISVFAFAMALIFSGSSAIGQETASEKVKQLWATDPVFMVPESVFYDENNQVLYVANINGKPTDKDSNGFLSAMEPDGRITRLEWVAGLHAPKGMAMRGDRLFVADIDRVAEIDIPKRTVVKFYEADKAEFLNDCIIGDEGRVYITDMKTGAIYRITGGEIEEWLPAGTFDSPNGINYRDGYLYLGVNGKIISIDPTDKSQKVIAEFEGSVDGLEIDKSGNFIFSDWSGLVRRVSAGGKPEVLFDTTDEKINAADIHLMVDENILLVPTFFDNRVVAYQILK
ncbi:MAG: SMP-30/gluconolactonase/LRE family protein [Bacteroidales bacterium]|jgi:sugar lactone lactonase YvrE|nr:SMP-30/gluconolactonase/LRE family protein [Bacteroidales bacterium]MDD2631931.1 SMP-30/gluconolactonase/LRE family protein [Bacteroidales bacterium]MDD3132477.1 SMP-30/gluconolactonase/LRE family protein [Bacteroidales bacterium]MDD3527411.1 SMP-30/gluconolactonase/LRE family protein [Bacteroidales bacterium]MDD4176230.1 SMP-30/gluconolactonase/LRE family protein [Bacteroidales bacterium]